ncbi:MAG: peptidylprolyl isomerase [Methanomicrobia archaeon]|nr:peptidylprolyl isomerase [Methanomicrobia archaeon]
MVEAKQGDTVKVHYRGTLEDGTIFDSSFDREPLEFTIGKGRLITGFEQAVIGMVPDESKTIMIPKDQAYGPHREDLVMELGRDQIPADMEIARGQQVQVRQEDGRCFPVMVTAISESGVTLDANHPLAGQDLTFELLLVEIC